MFTLEKKPIGKGGFVKVYKGKSTIEKDLEVAVKAFNKNLMSPEDIQAVKDEVDRLIQLDHPKIVKYLEWYEDK
jgi:serine/threonine protein kinase